MLSCVHICAIYLPCITVLSVVKDNLPLLNLGGKQSGMSENPCYNMAKKAYPLYLAAVLSLYHYFCVYDNILYNHFFCSCHLCRMFTF
jgi:hypothetical protein